MNILLFFFSFKKKKDPAGSVKQFGMALLECCYVTYCVQVVLVQSLLARQRRWYSSNMVSRSFICLAYWVIDDLLVSAPGVGLYQAQLSPSTSLGTSGTVLTSAAVAFSIHSPYSS